MFSRLDLDTLLVLACYLDGFSVRALMRCERALSASEELLALLPAPRLRNPFRFSVAGKEGGSVCVVVRSRTLELVLDFGLQRMAMPPEDPDRGPHQDAVEAIREATYFRAHLNPDVMRKKRERTRWFALNSHPHRVEAAEVERRMRTDRFFEHGPMYQPSLVFADTGEPVPSPWPLGLQLCSKNRKGGIFTVPPQRRAEELTDECALPARCKLHVPHLSSEFLSASGAQRAFRIRVDVSGVAAGSKRSVRGEVLTAPFYVVHTMDQAKPERLLERKRSRCITSAAEAGARPGCLAPETRVCEETWSPNEGPR